MALSGGQAGVVLIAADAALALGAAIAIIVVTLSAVLGLWVADRRRQARWREAWGKINRQPEVALRLLRAFARQPGPPPAKAKQHAMWQQARYGQAICLARLHRLDEAANALREAVGYAPDQGELGQLCAALLVAGRKNATPLAIDAWCQFLALPPTADFRETRRFLERALLKNLQPHPLDSNARLQQRLALAGRARQIAPRLPAIERAHGLILVRLERWAEAVAPLKAALADRPDDRQVLNDLATALRATGDRRRLLETLLAIHREMPTASVAYEAAMLTLELSDSEKLPSAASAGALALLKDAVKLEPEHTGAWLALARLQWQNRDDRPARSAAERAVSLEPRRVEAHFLLAEIQLAQNDVADARRILIRALQLEPGSLLGQRLAGDLEFADGDFRAALSHYQRLPKGEVEDRKLQVRMARCYLETGQPQAAIELLAKDTHRDDESLLVLARALAQTNRWPEALRLYEDQYSDEWLETAALPAENRGMPLITAELTYYYSAAVAANNKHAEAEHYFGTLFSDPAWGPRARRQLGHVRMLKGDYARAAELYRESDPSTSSFDLARAALVSGDLQQARELFAAARQAQPKSPAAIRFAIAYVDAELGQLDELQALVKDPELAADAQEALGDRAFAALDFPDALQAYEHAIAGNSAPPSRILQHLATGYLQLHRHQDAARHLTVLCQRQPDEVRLATNLAFCRWRLGRTAFENERWHDAHREFLAAFETLKDRQGQTAAALLAWALESAFRDVLAVLRNASAARDEIARAVEACRFGCQQAGRELRWQLVAGIATARAGEFASSVAHFQEACRLPPRLPAAMLGLALSQHEAGEHVAAAQTLAELLASLEDRDSSSEAESLRVRVGFAQAMVAARAKDWTAAAEALTPLITHPLVQGSNALSTRDLAEVAIAYHGAAGNHQQARQLAQLHLPDMRAPSDVLIGVVQADARDYAGAAATLGRSLRADNNPQVVKLLVSCILAIAAEAVLRGDLKTANNSIMAALGYEPQNKAAKNLLEALDSAGSGQAHREAIARQLLLPSTKIEGLIQPKSVRVTHAALLAELQPYVAEPRAVSDLHLQPIEMEIPAGAQRLPGPLKIVFDC